MHAMILAAALSLAAISSPSADKMPVLRRDSSPVNDGTSKVVTSYADVVDPVLKAVVSVYSSKTVRQEIPLNPFFRQFFGGQLPQQEIKEEGLGSGVVVTPDGYILTNNHVVEGADKLTVALSDNRIYPAKLVGADPKTDIAVIKIDSKNLPTVVLADSDKLRPGDIVFAVGNPLNVGETVTMGIVSAKGRSNLNLLDDVGGYESFIQTDAAINLGNSGGALIDAKGRLVGINSAIMSPSRGNIGIGFAIPVNLAANIMTSLIATGTVRRGYLGVTGETLTPDLAEQFGLARDASGVIVTDVTPGSPADKAGLKPSDVVTAVDGKPVGELEAMRLLISEYPPNTRVPLSIVRDSKPLTLTVTLGAENPDEFLTGVLVRPLTDQDRQQLGIGAQFGGLFVTHVAETSPYAQDIAQGMVIVQVNRMGVADVVSARRLLQPGRNLLLIYSQGAVRYLTVTVQAANSGG
ncbi:MAG TPA: Do family serine endopeptidase [Opitutaceae bacterium]|nr:Do family serine endopeptidase [Opitutaceae bacterium]